MTAFFVRLKHAFRTFFSILFRDRIPDDVLAAFGAAASPPAAPEPAVSVGRAPEASAAQVLAVLQRDGRLIDFLMEDVAAYSDAQVGAAVRNVHAGCRQALQTYVTLAPVIAAAEDTRVTVEAGMDASMVKVIGNVSGQPPFTGILRHRGWLASRIELPAPATTGQAVIAPAEVEVP